MKNQVPEGFCPKCYKEVYRKLVQGDNLLITQGGRTVFNVNKQSSINMNLSCPAGHPVKLVIKPSS